MDFHIFYCDQIACSSNYINQRTFFNGREGSAIHETQDFLSFLVGKSFLFFDINCYDTMTKKISCIQFRETDLIFFLSC